MSNEHVYSPEGRRDRQTDRQTNKQTMSTQSNNTKEMFDQDLLPVESGCEYSLQLMTQSSSL